MTAESQESTRLQLNVLDRTSIFLTEIDSVHNANLAFVLGLGAAAGAGVGTIKLIEHNAFATNQEYESKQSQISHLKAGETKIQNALNTLGVKSDVASGLQQHIGTYETQIASVRATLPTEYHPHVQGAVETGSFFVTATLAGVGLYKAIQHRAHKARAKLTAQNFEKHGE